MTKPHTTLSEAVRALEIPEPEYLGGDEVYGDRINGYTKQHLINLLEAAAKLVEQHEAQEPVAQCREDGRCQYAIDHGAEGLGACPVGKCTQPTLAATQEGDAMLQPNDLKALRRIVECCEDPDSGGHDVSKEKVARLCELGVLQSKGFGRHQVTSFGCIVIAIEFGEQVTWPLMTYAEYEAKSKADHEAKLTAMSPTTTRSG